MTQCDLSLARPRLKSEGKDKKARVVHRIELVVLCRCICRCRCLRLYASGNVWVEAVARDPSVCFSVLAWLASICFALMPCLGFVALFALPCLCASPSLAFFCLGALSCRA